MCEVKLCCSQDEEKAVLMTSIHRFDACVTVFAPPSFDPQNIVCDWKRPNDVQRRRVAINVIVKANYARVTAVDRSRIPAVGNFTLQVVLKGDCSLLQLILVVQA